MSSPFRSSDRSTPRSSPSRQRLTDFRNGQVNGHSRRLRESLNDSPSRQLWDEFNRLVIDEDNAFKRSLDTQDAEQARLHREALDQALREHEAVRQSAERAREQLELEIKRERLRREDEEKRAVAQARRALAEEEAAQQRRQLDEARQLEEERKQRESLQREREEQQRRAEVQKQREEQERVERRAVQEKEEADRKAREEAAAREREQQAQKPDPPPPQQAAPQQQRPNGVAAPAQTSQAPTQQQQNPATPAQPTSEAAQRLISSAQEREAVHERYLDLWRRLKVMRRSIEEQAKAAGFKELGNWRRDIRSRLGQLNKQDKRNNLDVLKKIRAVLDQAARMPQPSIDAAQFILSPDQPPTDPSGSTQMSGILLYLLNQLAKTALTQLLNESAVDTAMADPLGVLLCTLFSLPDYRCNGQSLIDLLWAKYHRLCPPLFGITGSEKTAAGRLRLGWDAERWAADAQGHYTRLTGLGAGFSALTLRDFSKSRNRNPAPNRLWWESMARILNLPPDQVQPTHYVLVKAMINDYAPRILQIFAGAGFACLRLAVKEFPHKAPRTAEGRVIGSAVAVEAMQVSLQQRYGLTL